MTEVKYGSGELEGYAEFCENLAAWYVGIGHDAMASVMLTAANLARGAYRG